MKAKARSSGDDLFLWKSLENSGYFQRKKKEAKKKEREPPYGKVENAEKRVSHFPTGPATSDEGCKSETRRNASVTHPPGFSVTHPPASSFSASAAPHPDPLPTAMNLRRGEGKYAMRV